MVEMESRRVPIRLLAVSPENVRSHREDAEEVESLAASIASAGLLQAPIVTLTGDGFYQAEAGGRRVRALKLLVERGQMAEGDEIEVRIAPEGASLTEISLAENYARKQLRPYEVYAAFAKIRDERPDATAEEIGALFGYDSKRTGRILRLANLAPPIFAEYAAETLTDAQAMAYAATEDQALQLAVWKGMKGKHDYARRADNIRAALRVGDKDDEQALRFVGEWYERYGGRFEADLFNEGTGRVLDPEILARAVAEKLQVDLVDRALLLNREVEWVEKLPWSSYSSETWDLRIEPKRAPLAGADKVRAAEIEARLAAIGPEMGKLKVKKTDEVKKGKEAEFAALRDEHAALGREAKEIEARRKLVLPKQGRILGHYSIQFDGRLELKFYFASKRDKGGADKAEGKGASIEKSPAEKQRLAWGLSKDPMQAMNMLRRDMIREQLVCTADTGIALDFLIYSQVRTILRPAGKTWDGREHIDGKDLGIETPACQDEGGCKAPVSVRRLYDTLYGGDAWHHSRELLKSLPWIECFDPVEGFALYRAAEQRFKDAAAAIVAGHGIWATTTHYGEGRTPRMIAELANILETAEGAQPWADTFSADAAFFELISHKARLQLLTSWGFGDHAKTLKKADSAAFCARVIKAVREGEGDEVLLAIDADTRAEIALWRPEWLDTAPVEPLPEPKPTEAAGDPLIDGGRDPNGLDDENLGEHEIGEAAE